MQSNQDGQIKNRKGGRKGEGSIYKRDPYWWGRVTIDGVEKRASLRCTTKKEAEAALSGWIASLGSDQETLAQKPRGTPFSEAVLQWNGEYLERNGVKSSTADRYLLSCRALDRAFGDLTVEEITLGSVVDFVSMRIKEDVSNRTIRRDLTALSSLLLFCQGKLWVVDNVALQYNRKLIKEPVPVKYEPPQWEEIRKFLTYSPEGMRELCELLAQSGMRAQEAAQLQRWQVDLSAKRVLLDKTKSNRPRAVNWRTPGGDMTDVLERACARVKDDDGFLFVNRDGLPYSNLEGNFRAVMSRAIDQEKQANRKMKRWRCHDLRHAFAIRWINEGGSIYRLRTHLGHTEVSTTEIYLLGLAEDIQERAKAI